MAGIIKICIQESVAELVEQLKKSENQELKERIQTLYWLKTQQVESTEAIARLTGKHRTTVSRWLSLYRKGGLTALLTKGKSSGRTRKLPVEVEEKLIQELREEIPENVILLFQPPYSPQVNPIERLWKEIKKKLKWELFDNLDLLRSRLAQILEELTPETIRSVTGWDFILSALSVANI